MWVVIKKIMWVVIFFHPKWRLLMSVLYEGRLDEQGRVLLPNFLREGMGINPGDTLQAIAQGKNLALYRHGKGNCPTDEQGMVTLPTDQIHQMGFVCNGRITVEWTLPEQTLTLCLN